MAPKKKKVKKRLPQLGNSTRKKKNSQAFTREKKTRKTEMEDKALLLCATMKNA